MSQSDVVKGALKSCAYPLRLFIPLSKRKREEYLDRVKTTIEKYKPLMEERTKTELGDVFVNELRYFVLDGFEKALDNIFSRRDKALEEVGDSFFARTIINGATYGLMPLFGLARVVTEAKRIIHEELHDFGYNNSTIYVSFNFSNKLKILQNKQSAHFDQKIVHELSHHLWEKLGGEGDEKPRKREKDSKHLRLWDEGFATYCEQEWFSDIYPEDYKIDIKNYGHYRKGKQKVEELIQRYGEDVLLKIPTEWKSFQSEVDSK